MPDQVDESHVVSLLNLHGAAGTFDDVPPGVLPSDRRGLGLIVREVAASSEVTPSAKLDALRALAPNHFEGTTDDPDAFDELARVVAGEYSIDSEGLLDDLKEEVGGARFASTRSGQQLPHHVTLGMEDVCQIREVTIGGRRATWIFSELETDAPFDSVAAWVKPDNWPKRGPMLFKSMRPIENAPATMIGGLDLSSHWHNLYVEQVQLVEKLVTALHCDYFEIAGRAAGVTYELDFSVDNKLNVDRGFLLVTDLGAVRHVKALKIVGFTEPAWTTVAQFVCPLWTDFVRNAVERGTTTDPIPGPGDPSPIDPNETPPVGDDDRRKVLDEWVDFFGDRAKIYTEMAGDVGERLLEGGYKWRDAAQDGAKYWSQVAKDWATAWAYSYDMMQRMADEGLEAIVGPPGSSSKARFFPHDRAASDAVRSEGMPPVTETHAAAGTRAAAATAASGESVIVPMPGIDSSATLSCSELVAIEEGGRRIPVQDITLSYRQLTKSVGGVEIVVRNPQAPAGLYIGDVTVGAGPPQPVQIYLSRAHGRQ